MKAGRFYAAISASSKPRLAAVHVQSNKAAKTTIANKKPDRIEKFIDFLEIFVIFWKNACKSRDF